MLAGGRGERMGGAKATAVLDGRPLIEHALDALRPLVATLSVVAKADTPLPDLGVEVWHDDEEGFHPRHGLVTALRREAPVLALAVDLPRSAPALKALTLVGPTSVTRADGRIQPLCALYGPEALAKIEEAEPDEPLTRTIERLHPVVVDVPAAWLVNANTHADLARLGSPPGCIGKPPSS